MPKFEVDGELSVRYTFTVIVEAEDADAAEDKVGKMDPDELGVDLYNPWDETVDVFDVEPVEDEDEDEDNKDSEDEPQGEV